MMKLVATLTALTAASVTEAKVTTETAAKLEAVQRDGIAAGSSLGRHLISKSRQLDQQNQQNYDMSFVSDMSIKFLGCHHVTQWASEAELEEIEEEDEEEMGQLNAANGRIRSKGIVRFRLCESSSCFDHFGQGCSSNYGEYAVSMTQFLEVYMEWQKEEAATTCETYRNVCYSACYASTDPSCYTSCYKKYGVDASLCANGNYNNNNGDGNGGQANYYNNGQNQDFDIEDYLECNEFELAQENDQNGEAIATYLGPYCAEQGQNIQLTFFQDKYCSIPSAYGANYYSKLTGYAVPYTNTPMVSTNCLSCQASNNNQQANAQQNNYYNYDNEGNMNYYQASEVNDLCGTMYMQSGKCETNMNKENVPYPEEGACTYIESVKRLKSDGIIRSDQKNSSRPASIAIGVFTGLAMAMGGYVYYLKQKIARSRVNLAGSTTALA